MAVDGRYRYNTCCYGVGPNSNSVVTEYNSGLFPQSRSSHMVYNIGRAEVYAEVIYGTAISWIGVVNSATVKPGEKKVIDNYGKLYYVLGVKVYNKTDTRAVVHVSNQYGDYNSMVLNDGTIDINYHALIKGLVIFGVKYVPYVGPTVSGLLSTFWPDNKPSAWDEVKDKVAQLVDSKILEAIKGILGGDLRHYQERIRVLALEMEDRGSNAATYYMNIAQDLVGFENKFTFENDPKTNFALLSLYSVLIMMKMSYYSLGIAKAQEIGLSDHDVADVKKYANRLLEGENGVIKYINGLYKERVDNAYNSANPEDIFNTMMDVRNYIAIYGIEYIPVWKYMLENPTSTKGGYNDVVSYSHFHGRPTPDLNKEAIPDEMLQPLTPKLIDGKRNKLIKVELHMWRIYNGRGAPKVGGLKVIFENGENYTMGTTSGEVNHIDFKGAYLTKLTVTGRGALDRFTFHFSDGRVESYGTDNSDRSTTFELKDHYIASMHLSNDSKDLAGQASNLCVSYMLVE